MRTLSVMYMCALVKCGVYYLHCNKGVCGMV